MLFYNEYNIFGNFISTYCNIKSKINYLNTIGIKNTYYEIGILSDTG